MLGTGSRCRVFLADTCAMEGVSLGGDLAAAGPAGPVAVRRPARWWSRIVAAAVDAVLVAVIGYAVILIIWLLHGYATTRVDGHAQTVLTERELWPFAAVWLLYAVGLQCRRALRNGETLGKAAVHIQVIRRDGAPVDLWSAFVREAVGKALPLALATITPVLSALAAIYIVLDSLWPLWDRQNRALHDRLAGTQVVRSDVIAPTR